MKFSVLLLCVSLVIRGTHSANILVVGTLLSHSHHFWIEAIAIGLVDKGHNITMLTHDKSTIQRANYTVITLEGTYETFESTFTIDSISTYTITPRTIPSFANNFLTIITELCKHDINHPTFHKFLETYPQDYKFDLILWDKTGGECLYPIIHRFGNPPIIGLSPYGLTNFIEATYGAEVYPYVGQIIMPFVIANSFWKRLMNIFYINYSNYQRATIFKQRNVELSKILFIDWDEDKYEQIEKRFSLCLINWNIALNVPQPLSPNLIPIGGVQIRSNERLPTNLKHIFDSPSKGVIYFSMGSNYKSEIFPLDILQSFCDCFSELEEYTILWKITSVKRLKLPKNTFTIKWAPQTAILAQNQTKLFISHGGALSTQESTYFGVPVVGVPLVLDQYNNVNKLKNFGAGEVVSLTKMIESKGGNDVFCETVKAVLFSESYKQKMKKLSARFRGGERTPLETAVHWVEYVLRHGDAKHLSPLSRNLSVFYTQNFDIYATGSGFVILLLWIVYGLIKFVRTMFTEKGSKKMKTS